MTRIKIRIYLGIVLLGLAGCAPQLPPAEQTAQVQAYIETAYADVVRWRTQTADALPRSATPTPTVTWTPTVTGTFTPTATDTLPPAVATETAAAYATAVLTAKKGDGIYRVGVDILPGVWQSDGTEGETCYWVRRKYDGIVLGQYTGKPGVQVRITSQDYEAEFRNCGTWEYIGQ